MRGRVGSNTDRDAHPSGPQRATGESGARTISLVVALGVAALMIAGSNDFALDDAWIHLAYAKSLRLGEGFSYNPHDWETGFSSPLWVLLLTVWPTSASPVVAVKLLGALLHGLCAWLGAQLVLDLSAARATPEHPLPRMSLSLLAGVLVATSPPLVEAATSGMEVPLAAALILATAWAMIGGRVRSAALLAALAVWARPEALPWTIVAAGTLAIAPRLPTVRRACIAAIAGGASALAVWSGWCLAWSGRPWPNTQLIKGAGGGLAGLSFLAEAVLPWQPWLVGITGVVLLSIALRREAATPGRELRAIVIATLVTTIAIAVTRPLHVGTTFYEARYFAPLAVAIPPCLALGLPARPRWLGPALVLPIAVVTGLQLADVRAIARAHEQDTELLHTRVASFVAAELPGDAVVAVEGAGALRYFTPRSMTIVDLVGLNDRVAAGLHRDRTAKLCHFVRRRPTHLVIPAAWVELYAPVFALAPVARFDDPQYTQVEPAAPLTVLVLAVRGVHPDWWRRCTAGRATVPTPK
jgi:hypothetical protein